jgi:hypothetical protein
MGKRNDNLALQSISFTLASGCVRTNEDNSSMTPAASWCGNMINDIKCLPGLYGNVYDWPDAMVTE